MVMALELRIEEMGYRSCLYVGSHVSGVSLNRELERPLCEAVKLQPWRTQDVRDTRVMGYLPWRATNREC